MSAYSVVNYKRKKPNKKHKDKSSYKLSKYFAIRRERREELKDLNEVIQRLYHQGRLKNKLLTALQARQFEDIKTEIINTITQGKGINEDSSIVKALREQNKNLTKASLEKVRDYIIRAGLKTSS